MKEMAPIRGANNTPSAIFERPALWTQSKRTVGLFATLQTPSKQ